MGATARRLLFLLVLAALAAGAAGCGGGSSGSPTTTSAAGASCAKASLTLVKPGAAHGRHRQPGLPAVVRRRHAEELVLEDQRPEQRQGLRVRRRLRGREAARLHATARSSGCTCRSTARSRPGRSRSTSTSTRSRTRRRARRSSRSATRTTTSTRRSSCSRGRRSRTCTTIAGLRAVQARRAARDDELRLHQRRRSSPSKQPAVFPQNAAAVQALKNRQIDGLVVDLPTAFYVTAVQVPNSTILGQFPTEAGGEHFGMVFAKGNPLVACVEPGARDAEARTATLQQIQQQWLAKATGAPVLK